MVADGREAFDTDWMQRATERLLEIIGEASNAISDEFKSDHPDVPWRHVVSLRHLLAHHWGALSGPDRDADRRTISLATSDVDHAVDGTRVEHEDGETSSKRFRHAVVGLEAVVRGATFDISSRVGEGRRFLGWSVGPHWLSSPRVADR